MGTSHIGGWLGPTCRHARRNANEKLQRGGPTRGAPHPRGAGLADTAELLLARDHLRGPHVAVCGHGGNPARITRVRRSGASGVPAVVRHDARRVESVWGGGVVGARTAASQGVGVRGVLLRLLGRRYGVRVCRRRVQLVRRTCSVADSIVHLMASAPSIATACWSESVREPPSPWHGHEGALQWQHTQ